MHNLSGIITAIPTPLDQNENVDVQGLQNIIDLVISEGTSGVFVLGSVGEGPALLDSQKNVVVETAAKHINGRVPLLAAISDISTKRTLEMGKMLQDLGSDFLVTTTPFYYSFPHPDSIKEFIDTLTNGLTTSLVFYNCPGMTGNKVSIETMEYIMHIPQVIAIKDSSGDLSMVLELLRRYPRGDTRPCSILQGDESVYDVSLMMGADGVVTGGGTVFTKLLVDLYTAALNQNKSLAFRLQQEFRNKMDDMLGPELLVDWVHAIKKELANKGICSDHVTSPFLKRM
jgi:4-hydroxy-tetrahydrodipicolinate synthase